MGNKNIMRILIIIFLIVIVSALILSAVLPYLTGY